MDDRKKIEEAFDKKSVYTSNVWVLLREPELNADQLKVLVDYFRFTLQPENKEKYNSERIALFTRFFSGVPRKLKEEVKPLLKDLSEVEYERIKELMASEEFIATGLNQNFSQFKKSLGAPNEPEVTQSKTTLASTPKFHQPQRTDAAKVGESQTKSSKKPPVGGVAMPGGAELAKRFNQQGGTEKPKSNKPGNK